MVVAEAFAEGSLDLPDRLPDLLVALDGHGVAPSGTSRLGISGTSPETFGAALASSAARIVTIWIER
jgi:hypothetical protein